MSNKYVRNLLRSVHVVGALLIGTAIYAPHGYIPFLLPVVQWSIIPILSVTGLWMWQMPRVSRWFKRGGSR